MANESEEQPVQPKREKTKRASGKQQKPDAVKDVPKAEPTKKHRKSPGGFTLVG